MADIRYVQAADLHLDTPFKGLSSDSLASSQIGRVLRGATFKALDNLVNLCLMEKPDFLLLAGDIYNFEERSIRAQLALADACKRLAASDIPVIICHGNHDPASSSFAAINWPENVKIFSTEAEVHELRKAGRQLASIHGISHGTDREGRNLAKMFHRLPDGADFQIGLLHCAVDVEGDRYAPCSLEDLRQTGLDAWALGHIHQRGILSEDPFIAYPGNSQGLHINERGEKGCFLVEATKVGNAWKFISEFRQLSPVVWKKLDINVDGALALDEVRDLAAEAVETEIHKASPITEALIFRLRLEGATQLNADLRNNDARAAFRERLERFSSAHPAAWIKDMEIATRDPVNLEDSRSREDLVGEIARYVHILMNEGAAMDNFVNEVTQPLFKNQLYRGMAEPFEGRILKESLEEAARMCQMMLEGK